MMITFRDIPFFGHIFLMFLICFIPSAQVMAAEVSYLSSIGAKTEYNDNIYYSRRASYADVEDVLMRIRPAFSVAYATEIFELKSSVSLDLLRYYDETDLNTQYYNCTLDGSYAAMERLTLLGNCKFIKDSTVESELYETGLATDILQDRTRTSGDIGIRYLRSEVSNIEVNYGYSKTDYQLKVDSDYDINSVGLTMSRLSDNQRDTYTIQTYYQKYDSEKAERSFSVTVDMNPDPFIINPVSTRLYSYSSSKTDNCGLLLGWNHLFSETLSFRASAGARYTETSYSQRQVVPLTGDNAKFSDSESGWSGVADISATKSGETWSGSVGYYRDLSYSSEGEPIDTDVISLNFTRRLTERWIAGFSGRLHFTKSDGTVYDRDTRYYTVSPSLAYKITEKHSLSFGYDYSNSHDNNNDTKPTIWRNRVWISMDFRFPEKR